MTIKQILKEYDFTNFDFNYKVIHRKNNRGNKLVGKLQYISHSNKTNLK